MSRNAISTTLICSFLLFQLLMPLRYYTGASGDDERFAWRMFSSRGMRPCTVVVTETVIVAGRSEEHEVDLEKAVQARWIELLMRYEPLRVKKFLELRCQREAIAAVHYESSCETPGGGRTAPASASLSCDSAAFNRQS